MEHARRTLEAEGGSRNTSAASPSSSSSLLSSLSSIADASLKLGRRNPPQPSRDPLVKLQRDSYSVT